MARAKKESVTYPLMDVLAASCAAHRVNGGYVKNSMADSNFVNDQGQIVSRVTNRELVQQFLASPDTVTDGDREQAEQIKTFYQHKTFKIISGDYISNFDRIVMDMFEQDRPVGGDYSISVFASMPSSYLLGKQRDDADRRIKFADGGYIGTLGERVTVKCMVLKSVFSQKYCVNFITAITDSEQPVFFSYKQDIAYGSFINITGTVKRQDKNTTQLNRVKVAA